MSQVTFMSSLWAREVLMKPSLYKADLLLNGLDLKSSSVFSTLLINFSSSGSGGSGSGDSDSGGVGSISSSSSSSF